MSEYYLYPPFFKNQSESSFADSWESFCLKLLKLENNTQSIQRRTPPEYGIDLFYKDKKIAYQCKSVADKDGNFNITKAKESLKSALVVKEELGWEEYYICANSDVTGQQIKKLKEEYENLELKEKNYWLGLCEKYPAIVQSNFRKLVDVPTQFQLKKIQNTLNIPSSIKDRINKEDNVFCIWIYTNNGDRVFQLKVFSEMLFSEFILLLRSILGVSNKAVINTEELKVSCGISFNDDLEFTYDGDKRNLQEIGITENSKVCLVLRFENDEWSTLAFQLNEESDKEQGILKYISDREANLEQSIHNYKNRGY